jgi:hypothetical protein
VAKSVIDRARSLRTPKPERLELVDGRGDVLGHRRQEHRARTRLTMRKSILERHRIHDEPTQF